MTTTKRQRPLSPHLQVYRWQITMTMSILHRATGVALAVGAFALVWWVLALSAGPDAYATFRECAGSLFGQLVLFGFVFCLIYHFFNGIRHLFWDIGWGLEIPKFYASGWTVLALTLVCSAGLVLVAVRAGGAA